MKDELMRVLIIGLSAPMQASIKALLMEQPGVDRILMADTLQSGQMLFLDYLPGLVLMDFEQPAEDIASFLNLARGQQSQTYSVGIVDTPRKEPAALQAGIDGVLVRGFSQDELMTRVIEAMTLHTWGKQGGKSDQQKNT